MLDQFRPQVKYILDPFARKIRINPNYITVAGLLVSLLAAYLFLNKNLLLGGVFIAISGFVDVLDGAVARINSSSTPFGGVLDSTIDRFADAIIIIGLILGGLVDPLIGILAIHASISVSYVRARAESEGIKCDVGIAERPERLVILMAGAFLGYLISPQIIYWAVVLVMILGYLTVIQRLYHTWKELNK